MSDITSTDLSPVSFPAAYYPTFIINTTHSLSSLYSTNRDTLPFLLISKQEKILDMKTPMFLYISATEHIYSQSIM